jgi:hypothetical protein
MLQTQKQDMFLETWYFPLFKETCVGLQIVTGSRNHMNPGRHFHAAPHGCIDLPHPGMSLKWWL